MPTPTARAPTVTKGATDVRLLPLGALAGLLLAVVSCEAYAPPADDAYTFHASFDFGVAHEDAGCDACHIEAANNMLDRVPDTPDSGWVTMLDVGFQPQSCTACHPFIRNPGTEEETVDCSTLPVGSALLESERCRYLTNANHVGGTTQDCTVCHQVSHEEWNYLGGGGPGGGNPHEEAPLVDVFPLEGGHEDQACGACHADLQNPQNEVGSGEYCANCHSRSDANVPNGASHYPPADPTAPETARDCFACHVNVSYDYADYSFSWPDTFGVRASDHGAGFAIDHGNGVNTCWNCHNVYDNDNGASTQPTFYQFEIPVQRGNCNLCHVDYVNGGVDPAMLSNTPGHTALDGACTDCHPDGLVPE